MAVLLWSAFLPVSKVTSARAGRICAPPSATTTSFCLPTSPVTTPKRCSEEVENSTIAPGCICSARRLKGDLEGHLVHILIDDDAGLSQRQDVLDADARGGLDQAQLVALDIKDGQIGDDAVDAAHAG